MAFAVFLDRDGTIVANRHYLGDPEGIELLPGAADGLRRLAALGARLVIVTNQSGVARGYFGLADVDRVHERLAAILSAEGVELAGIYVCPHGPDDGCDCRKPKPGLLVRAARELDIDLSRAFMVGDESRDAEAGRAAGARAYQLGVDATDLAEAAELIARAAGPPA